MHTHTHTHTATSQILLWQGRRLSSNISPHEKLPLTWWTSPTSRIMWKLRKKVPRKQMDTYFPTWMVFGTCRSYFWESPPHHPTSPDERKLRKVRSLSSFILQKSITTCAHSHSSNSDDVKAKEKRVVLCRESFLFISLCLWDSLSLPFFWNPYQQKLTFTCFLHMAAAAHSVQSNPKYTKTRFFRVLD